MIGGVAGATSRNPGEEYKGVVIDGCEVKGKINGSSTNRNLFEGALVGYFNNGAIINCVSDAEIDGTNNSAWLLLLAATATTWWLDASSKLDTPAHTPVV